MSGQPLVGEIDEGISPADVAAGGLGHARGDRDFGEVHRAFVAIEGGVFVVEVGNENRKAAGMEVIAQGDAHVGLGLAVLVVGHAGGEAGIGEPARAVALVEIVGLAVVGHKADRVCRHCRSPTRPR